MDKPWTIEEEQKLKDLYPKAKTKDLANLLGRSPGAIRLRASQLKVKANRPYHHLINPELNQYDTLTVEERAYIAGILDGEGTIGFTNHRTKYTASKIYSYWLPSVSFSNTNKALMDWLHQKLKGSLCQANHHRKPQHSPCWALHLRGNLQVKKLLIVLLPYLIVKKEKAVEVLNHHTTFEYIAS